MHYRFINDVIRRNPEMEPAKVKSQEGISLDYCQLTNVLENCVLLIFLKWLLRFFPKNWNWDRY